MEFKITRASDFEFEDKKVFTTIEELKDYITIQNPKTKSCVIYFDDPEVLIYDTWIE